MQLCFAVFHSDYKDMPISVVDGPAPTIKKAGDATIDGADSDLTWQPVRALTLNAFTGYLDAQYDSLSERTLRSGVTHEVKNLFVGGPGVFPTSSAVNSTFTAKAMALKSAKFMIANWEEIAV